MNGRMAKRVRKEGRKEFKKMMRSILAEPWYIRLYWGFYIIFHRIKKTR